MVVFLQDCCIYSMTELCLPWTECRPALCFQQGQEDSLVLWCKPARTAWGLPPRDWLHYLVVHLNEPLQDLSWPGVGSRCPVMHVALGLSSDSAASQTKLLNCHGAGLWLPFLTPHSPVMTAHPQTACHLVLLVSELSSRTCREPVPSSLFSGQAQLHFL